MIRTLTIYSHFAQVALARVAANLAQGFIERGLDVDVVYVKDPLSDVKFPASARLVRLPAPRSSLSVPSLVRYLRANRPDVVIAVSGMQNVPSVLARMVSQFEGVLLLSEHALMSYQASLHRGDLRRRMMPAFARHLYPQADGLAAVSEDVLRDLVEAVGISPDRLPMRVIHNPIDVESIRCPAREPVDHPWLRQKREPVILNVARLAKEKNQELLLEAVARVRARRNIRLIILGEGPLRADLQRAIHRLGLDDCVDMPGHVPNPFPYFAQADAFVLSSESEGLPSVVMEAMACGCPVIATACPGGSRKLLQDGKYGVLVPPRDVETLVSAVTRVLDDAPDRTALVESGTRGLADFAPAKIAEEWIAFAEELLHARGSNGRRTSVWARRGAESSLRVSGRPPGGEESIPEGIGSLLAARPPSNPGGTA